MYGQVLTAEHFLNNTETTSLFELLLQAEQIADAVHWLKTDQKVLSTGRER